MQREIAVAMGIPKENTFILNSGDVLSLSGEHAEIVGHVQVGGLMVDGLGVGDVGNVVLRERQMLSVAGLIMVVMAIEQETHEVVSGPDIISRGFVYMRESEELIEELTDVVNSALDDCYCRNITDYGRIKNKVKDELSDYLWKRMRRSPVILPVIMEV